uniref:Ribosomal protein L15 n=1 Tax=Angiostrongylus cantonensis TaxID=6313 RepID=A0A0K0DJZ3_ANGCA
MEALGSQGVPSQYVKILREPYNNFTTKISPFYNDINVDVKRGVRQGDPQNVMNDARRVPRASRTHWAILAREREKWRVYWCPLESLDDRRDYN